MNKKHNLENLKTTQKKHKQLFGKAENTDHFLIQVFLGLGRSAETRALSLRYFGTLFRHYGPDGFLNTSTRGRKRGAFLAIF